MQKGPPCAVLLLFEIGKALNRRDRREGPQRRLRKAGSPPKQDTKETGELAFSDKSYSFRSTCSTESTGWPKNRGPKRRNFSTESVAKKRRPVSDDCDWPGGCVSERIRSATTAAVECAESTIATCAGATRRSKRWISG